MNHFIIAKEFFDSSKDVQIERIDQQDWEKYIDDHTDQFVWMEETELGKNRRLQMDTIPEVLKNRIRSAYGKKLAIAESSDINPFYLECWYPKESGTINISVRNDLTKESIQLLEELTENLQVTIFFSNKWGNC